jgi:hypothetical protein
MSVRYLDPDVIGLEEYREEMIYSEARCSVDADAEDQVALYAALVQRAEEAERGQRICWRAEVLAHARVNACDYALDLLTGRFKRTLARALEDTGLKNAEESPRFKRYFRLQPHAVTEMALEAQIDFMKDWPQALANEPEPELRELVPLFTAAFAEGREALAARSAALAKTRDHRFEQIYPLFEDGNKLRRIIFGVLTARAAERSLGEEWPEKFHRKPRDTRSTPQELKQRAILSMLRAQGIAVSPEGRKKIVREKSLPVLDRWCARAPAVTAEAELFAA